VHIVSDNNSEQMAKLCNILFNIYHIYCKCVIWTTDNSSFESSKIELINREHLTAAYKLQPNPSNPNSVELSEYFHDLWFILSPIVVSMWCIISVSFGHPVETEKARWHVHLTNLFQLLWTPWPLLFALTWDCFPFFILVFMLWL